ncbi:MAG: molybdate ABC transporter substrate-binding protein [Clostridium sp.]|nr:molybdate ABC transporter substrate-binding protein [Clostridium sp.]
MKKIKKLLLISIAAALLIPAYGCDNTNKKDEEKIELTISAAASLKEVMGEIEKEFTKDNPNIKLSFNFGSSGSLQKQIQEGAPSDIFISAGENQMLQLEKDQLIDENSLSNLLNNQLVLISSSDNIKTMDDLKNVSHIAMGEPTSVPAGKYADESLTSLNLKDSLAPKLVYGKDVKEVLAWVLSKDADAGFVYKSDTYNVDSINVVDTIGDEYHSPINYPIAIIKETKNHDAAKTFEDYLFTNNAKELFDKYGYKPR